MCLVALAIEEPELDGVGVVSKLRGQKQRTADDIYELIRELLRWADIQGKPSTFPPAAHNHDDRYFTDDEIDQLLSGKSNTNHAHDHTYFTQEQINNLIADYTTNERLAILFSQKANLIHNHDTRYYQQSVACLLYTSPSPRDS